MTVPGDERPATIRVGTFEFPEGLEASCAVGSPLTPGYCFGFEDGTIGFATPDGRFRTAPIKVSPSGEAINGIAFKGDLLAASTRSDVVLTQMPLPAPGGKFERAVFHGGAFDVVPTATRGFAAPMGRRGIMLLEDNHSKRTVVRIFKPPGDDINAYKIACVPNLSGGELIACAARRRGLLAMSLSAGELRDHGRRLRPSGVDFVDVSPMGYEEFPYAVAGLGIDSSIHLVKDLLNDRSFKTLHFHAPGETAYRVLATEGHIFLLTNKRLCVFLGMAERFLRGLSLEGLFFAHTLDVEAVDISLTPDRMLLITMLDSVGFIPIDTFVYAGEHGPGSSWSPDVQEVISEGPDLPRWAETESFELMAAY
jgi:hypothetical protein